MDLQRLRAALFALVILAAGAARADLFSPGPLSHPHASLEGLRSCTKCHEAGSQLSQGRCLSCHKELDAELQAGTGFHGKLAEGDRACQKCHREHRGENAPLVEWGPGGQQGFDHATTGYTLDGAHARVACKDCHDARLIDVAAVQKLLSARPGTFLGLSRSCKSCHFDEHRGQLGSDCAKCHSSSKWKPAPHFDHAKTDFALLGAHKTTACEKCHVAKVDSTTPAAAFPAPRSPTFLTLKGVEHSSCADCHKDPHEGRFGARCQSCHVEDAWATMKGVSRERAFHEKTRYPLQGAHADVSCKACHGPWPGRPAKFKGLAFGACKDCHLDAHLGQFQDGHCEKCHTVDGFTPARFDIRAHEKTRYPLEGSHLAVACTSCHPTLPALKRRIPERLPRELARKDQKLLVSLARFEFPDAADCRTCHQDPHRGQFAQRMKVAGCPVCHVLESFSDLSRFDHARDTHFALTGKHAATPCASCHRQEKKGATVHYAGLATACSSCHADVHVGQLARAGDCGTCHGTGSFKPAATFVHGPPFTSFELQGKHAAVSCARCHPSAEVAPGVQAVRYQGLPTTCEGCHSDFHKGEMERFLP